MSQLKTLRNNAQREGYSPMIENNTNQHLTMKKIIIKGLVAGAILLLFSYLALHLVVRFLPDVAEQYYNPMFDMEGNKTYLYFLHPFILSFALAWFWSRFKKFIYRFLFGGEALNWGLYMPWSPPCPPCGSPLVHWRSHFQWY